jgi:hypothetical protein
VELALLTKPAQPVIAPSGASDANNRNTLPKKEECPAHCFNDLADAIAISPLAFLRGAWFVRRRREGDEHGTEFACGSISTIT